MTFPIAWSAPIHRYLLQYSNTTPTNFQYSAVSGSNSGWIKYVWYDRFLSSDDKGSGVHHSHICVWYFMVTAHPQILYLPPTQWIHKTNGTDSDVLVTANDYYNAIPIHKNIQKNNYTDRFRLLVGTKFIIYLYKTQSKSYIIWPQGLTDMAV